MTFTHECPGHCGTPDVPNQRFACPSCWHMLPYKIRRRISEGWLHQDEQVQFEAARDAYAWFRANRPARKARAR